MHFRLFFACVVAVIAMGCTDRGTFESGPSNPAPPAFEQILTEQAAAWNRGDIDGFMAHYWRSPKLTFSAGGTTETGWEATRDRYRRRYPTPEKMGRLEFSELQVHPLGSSAALVLGRWKLIRRDDAPEGNFSLIFERIDGRWVIVHDHSSSLPPPALSPGS